VQDFLGFARRYIISGKGKTTHTFDPKIARNVSTKLIHSGVFFAEMYQSDRKQGATHTFDPKIAQNVSMELIHSGLFFAKMYEGDPARPNLIEHA
ncbi:MAG: hypothetical protein J6Q41_05410, partial [Firmicutes bacterium]|nr:hypothetical protein [Bacillota bacterium]